MGELLVAPAILNADELSLADRAAARKDLINRSKNNKLSVTEMPKGTFKISNLSLSLVRHFTPIVNAPQIAILGLGEIRKQFWECSDGELQHQQNVKNRHILIRTVFIANFDIAVIDRGP